MQSAHGAAYEPGQKIQGRWRIRSIVGGHGSSGMGIVYIADDLLEQRTVAIKTFQPELVANEHIRTLLLREANVWLAMGRHRNIVHVESVEVFGSQPFIIMEYVQPDAQGRNTLTHHLTGEPLPDDLVARWAVEICEAIVHMRACGIEAHRDLKPDNVMIDRHGTVKVTDFGLARAYHGSTRTTPLTEEHIPGLSVAGSLVGTPGYIAPEVVLGDEPDVRSDIFALGLILAQMISGQAWAPLTGEWRGNLYAYEEANLEIRRTQAPPTDRSPLHGIVLRCLRIDPIERFEHFVALAHELRVACARAGIDLAAQKPDPTPPPDTRDRDALGRINALYKLGRHREALIEVRQLRRDSPLDTRLLDIEGTLLTDSGDLDRAMELLALACEIEPKDPAHWNNLARARLAAGDVQAALDACDKSLDLDPDNINVCANRGMCLVHLERHQEAITSFQQALAGDPYNVSVLLGYANALHGLGQEEEALVMLERVTDVEPESEPAIRLRQICRSALGALPAQRSLSETLSFAQDCYDQGRYQEGLSAVRSARFRFGANTELWIDEGAFLSDLGEHAAALRCFDRVLREHPDRFEALTNKARVLRHMGRPQEAIPLHDRALALAPDEWLLWINKAACQEDLQLKSQTLESFRQAYQLASQVGAREACVGFAPNTYAILSAQTLIEGGRFRQADVHARMVHAGTLFSLDALQLGARAALSRARRELSVDPADDQQAMTTLGLLERASLELTDQIGTDDPQPLLTTVQRDYLDRNFPTLVEREEFETAERVLRSVLRFSRDDEQNDWARRQLAVVLANRAIEESETQPLRLSVNRLWQATALFEADAELCEVRDTLLNRAGARGVMLWADERAQRAALTRRYQTTQSWLQRWQMLLSELAALEEQTDEAEDLVLLGHFRAAARWACKLHPAEFARPQLSLYQACRLYAAFGQSRLPTEEVNGLPAPLESDCAPLLEVVDYAYQHLLDRTIPWTDARALYEDFQQHHSGISITSQPLIQIEHGNVRFEADALPVEAASEYQLTPCDPHHQQLGLLSPSVLGISQAPTEEQDTMTLCRVDVGGCQLWMVPWVLATLEGGVLRKLTMSVGDRQEPLFVAC